MALIRVNVLDMNHLSLAGIPWEERGAIDPDQIESIRTFSCRGFENAAYLRTKSGDRMYVAESVGEIMARIENREWLATAEAGEG